MSWWVFPAHRRRGVASRAVRLAIAYAFSHLGVRRIEALTAPDNAASRGVARRAGFTEVDPVEDGEQPMLRHLLLADGPELRG
jgi:RimJ/RimL family protein N-acetyltransferase